MSTSVCSQQAPQSASAWTVRCMSVSTAKILAMLTVNARDLRDAMTRGMTTESRQAGVLVGQMLGLDPNELAGVPANDSAFGKLTVGDLAVLAWRQIDDAQTAFEHRIERRNWYVGGKYLGDKSPWVEDVGGNATAKSLTGDFFGEWQGRRHFDGRQIVDEAVAREKTNRATGARNHAPDTTDGKWFRSAEIYGSPIALGDWGEYRVVTWPAAPSSGKPLA